MNILKHLWQQPFVASTGVAALVHSTWSLGTLFSGKEPATQFSFEWFAWLIPAFLIAFALDVGQIATSGEIRAGKRNWRKYATFAVFAIATYYLQWLYMAHHMPLLDLAPGVRSWSALALPIRDAAIWFIPALLPLSTLLYTFSHDEEAAHAAESVPVVTPIVTVPDAPLLQSDNAVGVIPQATIPVHLATCPDCDWTGEYDNPKSAKMGLRTHQTRYCGVRHALPNGANHDHS